MKTATVEQTKFGVVITFPPKSSVNSQVYKMLLKAGFEKAGAMGWNHWLNDSPTDQTMDKAGEIVQEYHSGKPSKQRLYPKKPCAAITTRTKS